ncbi:MAG: hypothetical protein KKD73_01585 [Proteobacteria bacterium]|nr:hypothetical protein [Pseudomonadota bacterium]MBU1640062.1 hypothetical protein [Pseudomonadota bacterium]
MVTAGFNCHTVELPWRDNAKNVSCIPAGEYLCQLRKSPRFGWVFCLQDVKGRQFVLLHTGNLAGDTSKGWKTNSAGCLLLGRYRGRLGKQKAIMVSRPALRDFMATMGKDDFNLTILEV